MSRFDDISTRNVATFAILAISAVFLLGNPFALTSSDQALSVHGCSISQTGDTYNIDGCTEDNNVNSQYTVAYYTEQLSEFSMIGPNDYYVQFAERYMLANGVDGSAFTMECTSTTDFDDSSRDIHFCTDNQDVANEINGLLPNGFINTNADEVGATYVVETDGFPSNIAEELRSSSSCTATLTSYEGVTVQTDGEVYFLRSSVADQLNDGLTCVVDLPDGNRGYGQHSVSWTIDASFTTDDTDTGTGDDDSGGGSEPSDPDTEPVGFVEQIRLTVINLFNRIAGVFM